MRSSAGNKKREWQKKEEYPSRKKELRTDNGGVGFGNQRSQKIICGFVKGFGFAAQSRGKRVKSTKGGGKGGAGKNRDQGKTGMDPGGLLLHEKR